MICNAFPVVKSLVFILIPVPPCISSAVIRIAPAASPKVVLVFISSNAPVVKVVRDCIRIARPSLKALASISNNVPDVCDVPFSVNNDPPVPYTPEPSFNNAFPLRLSITIPCPVVNAGTSIFIPVPTFILSYSINIGFSAVADVVFI